jgi:putative glutamine amidotransferase
MYGLEVDLHFADYFAAVVAAGGLPVGLSRNAPAGPMVERLDGLVLSGGADVDPRAYGEEAQPGCGPVEADRDAWEFALLAGALERNVPVLAICRGIQLVNVHFGGTLVQDIARDAGDCHPRFDSPRGAPGHAVRFTDGSLAGELYGATTEVNSLHHQAVERVGDGLVVTGRSPDGTVEALELPDRPLLAVQWHPELMRPQPDPAMTWVVEAARAFAEPLRV